MATSTVSRLAPANARDGVNTRKQVNWATAAAGTRETICRSDMIIGLGNPAVTNWGDMMTGMYCNSRSTAAPVTSTKSCALRLYEDMADEPWKYEDDMLSVWEPLDEKLRAGPERADVESYWQSRDAREKAEQARKDERYRAEMDARRVVLRLIVKEVAKIAMKRWIDHDIKAIVKRFKGSATKIQTMVRGYQARCKNPHLDCCMCLSHCISPLKTNVGYMCRDCAEQGPYEDLVENDPWNWHRAEYVDEAPNHQLYVPCNWCNKDFYDLWNGDYCSYECEWKDRTA